MKLSLLALAALVAVAYAASDISPFRKRAADSEFLDKQRKVLKLLVGLGADTKTFVEYEHTPFPYNKPEYFTKPVVLENFMKSYDRGFLDRQGVFTFFCHKNKHDTLALFDLFYYAKDFDTFYNIASWARDEMNPIQWSYAFITAVFHREDTRGLYVPPLYEIFPSFFTQSEVMHRAASAKHQGETYGKFDVNNTGWEWSWYNDILSGPHKASYKWVGDDVEDRMSYFREDVGLANFFTYFNMRFAHWLSHGRYSDINFVRRGDIYYGVYKWIKNRYNLERMVNGLPPVTPFEVHSPLPGYNPHIQDIFGRSFLVRDDNIVPSEANPTGTWEFSENLGRIYEAIDSGITWLSGSETKFTKFGEGPESETAFDDFAQLVFGAKDYRKRNYYKQLYFEYMRLANNIVKAPNDRDFTTTALGMTMTAPRDPVFYKILAGVDFWFNKFFATQKPYTNEELSFPGVSVEKFELDRLDTYFEHYDWELTNSIHFANRADRVTKRFEASQFRLNHKPFSYKLSIKSDKDADVFVRVYIGPKTDVDGRQYSLEQQRKAMTTLEFFRYKLHAGDNDFERHSHQFGFFETYQKFRPFYEKVNKSIETKEPFFYHEMSQCGIPHNLLIPRGWKSGKEFALFVVVTPFKYNVPFARYYQCHHYQAVDQFSSYFPFDRPIVDSDFVKPNMHFSSVKIYHDQDVVTHDTHH